MSDLETVKACRKAHQGIVTRLINESTPLLKGEKTERILTCLKTNDEQLVEKMRTLRNLDERDNNVLESETIVDKIAHLRGEISAFIKKPFKLPREPDVNHVPHVDMHIETIRTECPSSAGSVRTEESNTPSEVRLKTQI